MRIRAVLGSALSAVTLVFGLPAAGHADLARSWTLSAPHTTRDGLGPEAAVDLTPDGRLTLSVQRGGRTVLEPSALGVETAHADFTKGLNFAGISQRPVRERYTTMVGRRLEHEVDAAETTLRF